MSYNTPCLDILRATWISQLQDRYHVTEAKDMMLIISYIDSLIHDITEDEAQSLM